MQWSMPHRVLQVVATLIVLVALSAFTLGVVNAPQRGRMPGEKGAGEAEQLRHWPPLTPLRSVRIASKD